ncbi:MAG TPA: succinate dehydrogenase iron-sulfur subunit [Candidatus Binatia bacterium]|nr:succinate dehydrogenase iron-sulfur subunit [Candidatus Binatia bacterium]
MPPEYIELRVKRQDGPEAAPYWHAFRVPWKPQHNVLSVLMEIRTNPVTTTGERVPAPVWDASCLEEVCGACTMLVNGHVRQACTALVDQLEQPIVLEPMRKFPVVRDLFVDRTRIFESFKKVHAWIPVDGTYDLGPGPRMSPEEQELRYALDRCIACGCCMDVCPQFHLDDPPDSGFVGAATIGQALLMNLHPTGRMNADERLDLLMRPGGIQDCGNAQNCVEACPKGIPLTHAIAEIGRQTTVKWVKDLLGR